MLWVRSWSGDDHVGRLRVSVANGVVREHRSGVFSGDGRLAVGTGDLEVTEGHLSNDPRPAARDSDRWGWDTTPSSWLYCEYDDTFPLGFAAEVFKGQ